MARESGVLDQVTAALGERLEHAREETVLDGDMSGHFGDVARAEARAAVHESDDDVWEGEGRERMVLDGERMKLSERSDPFDRIEADVDHALEEAMEYVAAEERAAHIAREGASRAVGKAIVAEERRLAERDRRQSPASTPDKEYVRLDAIRSSPTPSPQPQSRRGLSSAQMMSSLSPSDYVQEETYRKSTSPRRDAAQVAASAAASAEKMRRILAHREDDEDGDGEDDDRARVGDGHRRGQDGSGGVRRELMEGESEDMWRVRGPGGDGDDIDDDDDDDVAIEVVIPTSRRHGRRKPRYSPRVASNVHVEFGVGGGRGGGRSPGLHKRKSDSEVEDVVGFGNDESGVGRRRRTDRRDVGIDAPVPLVYPHAARGPFDRGGNAYPSPLAGRDHPATWVDEEKEEELEKEVARRMAKRAATRSAIQQRRTLSTPSHHHRHTHVPSTTTTTSTPSSSSPPSHSLPIPPPPSSSPPAPSGPPHLTMSGSGSGKERRSREWEDRDAETAKMAASRAQELLAIALASPRRQLHMGGDDGERKMKPKKKRALGGRKKKRRVRRKKIAQAPQPPPHVHAQGHARHDFLRPQRVGGGFLIPDRDVGPQKPPPPKPKPKRRHVPPPTLPPTEGYKTQHQRITALESEVLRLRKALGKAVLGQN